MKKLFLNKLTIGMLAAVTLLSSCGKDEDTEPDDVNPTIGFLDNTGTDKTVQIGEIFKFKVNAVANSTSGKKLKELVVMHGSNNTVDTTVEINDANYTGDFEFKGEDAAAIIKWTVKVTDKDGKTASKSFKVTTEAAESDINIFKGKILGGKSNTSNGSFYDAHGGESHLQKHADENQAMIDIVYYYGATNKAALGAPDDTEGVHKVATNVADWTTQNATRFATTEISAADFDKINYDTQLGELNLSPDAKSVTQLAADQVFVFKTHDDKLGLVKVVSIQPDATGSITIDVKVQK